VVGEGGLGRCKQFEEGVVVVLEQNRVGDHLVVQLDARVQLGLAAVVHVQVLHEHAHLVEGLLEPGEEQAAVQPLPGHLLGLEVGAQRVRVQQLQPGSEQVQRVEGTQQALVFSR